MNNKSNTPCIYPSLGIVNTYKPAIDYIYKLTGGYYYKSHKKVLSKKELYRISFNREAMNYLLKELYPYLKIKKKQAKLALRLLKSVKSHKRDKRGRIKKLNKKTYEYRLKIYNEFREVIKEGKTVLKGKKCIRW